MSVLQVRAVQHKCHPQTKVAGKQVDKNRATCIVDSYVFQHSPLCHSKDRDLHQSHDQELHRTSLPEHGSERDEHHSTGKLSIQQVDHPQVYFALMEKLEEPLHQDRPLDCERGSQKVENHAAEAVESEEGQKAAEADEDHHLYVSKERVVIVDGVLHGVSHVVLHLGVGIIIISDKESKKNYDDDLQHQHKRRQAHLQAC